MGADFISVVDGKMGLYDVGHEVYECECVKVHVSMKVSV